MKSTLPRFLAFLAVFSAVSCSSHFSSNKVENAGTAQLTAQQKKEQLAQLSVNLQGVWTCSGSTNGTNQCFGEQLTFNSALDHLSIDNYWHFCQMHNDYELSLGTEDADGMTDFTIHSSGLGTLVGTSSTNQDCKNFLTSFSGNPLEENFSFTHSADWSELTIGDNSFKKSASPQPSPSPSASIQLPNS